MDQIGQFRAAHPGESRQHAPPTNSARRGFRACRSPFSTLGAAPLPLVLVGFLMLFFLLLESHRYRYVNVWRARVLE